MELNSKNNKIVRIAIVVSHPIQHFCPQYASFAKIDFIKCKVFFASALGYKRYYDPSFEKEISWGNLYLDEFDHHFMNGDLVLPADGMLDAISVESDLKSYAPDVVVIYGYFQKFQRRAHKWAVKNNIRLAYISDSELKHPRNFLKRVIKYYFIKKYFSLIDLFLSVGDSNEAYYAYYGVKPDKIIRMHFPIDLYQYEKAYSIKSLLRDKVRNDYKINIDEFTLSVVGKLVAWKSQGTIIAAMKLLEEKQIFINLFIIGSGNEEMKLRLEAKKLKYSKVYFTGFVAPEDLPAYYAASDIYVHPAAIEPHSIAISEAIYMGCPVIISDRCGSYGINDDVQEGRNGFVFPYNNVQLLAGKIEKLITDEELRKCFSEYSHSTAIQFQDIAHKKVMKKLHNHFIPLNG